jgi:DNA-binding NtrC family response regulator
VRELRNLMERAALLCDGDTLEAGHLEQALMSGRRPAAHPMGQSPAPPDSAACAGPGQDIDARKVPHPPRGLRDIEYAALRERAALHRGSRAALAAELGISERSLYRKLKAAGAA